MNTTCAAAHYDDTAVQCDNKSRARTLETNTGRSSSTVEGDNRSIRRRRNNTNIDVDDGRYNNHNDYDDGGGCGCDDSVDGDNIRRRRRKNKRKYIRSRISDSCDQETRETIRHKRHTESYNDVCKIYTSEEKQRSRGDKQRSRKHNNDNKVFRGSKHSRKRDQDKIHKLVYMSTKKGNRCKTTTDDDADNSSDESENKFERVDRWVKTHYSRSNSSSRRYDGIICPTKSSALDTYINSTNTTAAAAYTVGAAVTTATPTTTTITKTTCNEVDTVTTAEPEPHFTPVVSNTSTSMIVSDERESGLTGQIKITATTDFINDHRLHSSRTVTENTTYKSTNTELNNNTRVTIEEDEDRRRKLILFKNLNIMEKKQPGTTVTNRKLKESTGAANSTMTRTCVRNKITTDHGEITEPTTTDDKTSDVNVAGMTDDYVTTTTSTTGSSGNTTTTTTSRSDTLPIIIIAGNNGDNSKVCNKSGEDYAATASSIAAVPIPNEENVPPSYNNKRKYESRTSDSYHYRRTRDEADTPERKRHDRHRSTGGGSGVYRRKSVSSPQDTPPTPTTPQQCTQSNQPPYNVAAATTTTTAKDMITDSGSGNCGGGGVVDDDGASGTVVFNVKDVNDTDFLLMSLDTCYTENGYKPITVDTSTNGEDVELLKRSKTLTLLSIGYNAYKQQVTNAGGSAADALGKRGIDGGDGDAKDGDDILIAYVCKMPKYKRYSLYKKLTLKNWRKSEVLQTPCNLQSTSYVSTPSPSLPHTATAAAATSMPPSVIQNSTPMQRANSGYGHPSNPPPQPMTPSPVNVRHTGARNHDEFMSAVLEQRKMLFFIKQYLIIFSMLTNSMLYNQRGLSNVVVVNKYWVFNNNLKLYVPHYELLKGDMYTDYVVGSMKNKYNYKDLRFYSTDNTILYNNSRGVDDRGLLKSPTLTALSVHNTTTDATCSRRTDGHDGGHVTKNTNEILVPLEKRKVDDTANESQQQRVKQQIENNTLKVHDKLTVIPTLILFGQNDNLHNGTLMCPIFIEINLS